MGLLPSILCLFVFGTRGVALRVVKSDGEVPTRKCKLFFLEIYTQQSSLIALLYHKSLRRLPSVLFYMFFVVKNTTILLQPTMSIQRCLRKLTRERHVRVRHH